jgi:hypothetical protein
MVPMMIASVTGHSSERENCKAGNASRRKMPPVEISAGEVGLNDLHQRARMAVSFVSIDDPAADAMLDRILSFVETNTDATLTGWTSEKLAFDESISLGVPHFS